MVYQGSSPKLPLEKLYLHDKLDNYDSATNQLQTPLVPGEKVDFANLKPGSTYLTVVRKKTPVEGSELIAATTSEPVVLQSGRVVVWVFDTSFRIYDPVLNTQP